MIRPARNRPLRQRVSRAIAALKITLVLVLIVFALR
jgi:hypothetical protein